MHTRTPIIVLALLCAASAGALAQAPDDAAGNLLARALTEPLPPETCVAMLERVVKESPESIWADDALWALGEAARRRGDSRQVVCYWQLLIGRWPQVHVEPFTQNTTVYRYSNLAGANYLLRAEGAAFTAGAPRVVLGDQPTAFMVSNATLYDPATSLVWDGLGDCYAELGKPDLAVMAYQKAAEAAPTVGTWATAYRQKLEKKFDAQKKRPKTATSVAAPVADSGPSMSGNAPPDVRPPDTSPTAAPAAPHPQPEASSGD